ncbi:MAG: aa3-type cytochrome c oxidase subunit IV [Pseudomonadota bacterium]
MADHEHGKMDTKVQEATFAGFVKFTTYTVVGILIFLVLLAMVNG